MRFAPMMHCSASSCSPTSRLSRRLAGDVFERENFCGQSRRRISAVGRKHLRIYSAREHKGLNAMSGRWTSSLSLVVDLTSIKSTHHGHRHEESWRSAVKTNAASYTGCGLNCFGFGDDFVGIDDSGATTMPPGKSCLASCQFRALIKDGLRASSGAGIWSLRVGETKSASDMQTHQ